MNRSKKKLVKSRRRLETKFLSLLKKDGMRRRSITKKRSKKMKRDGKKYIDNIHGVIEYFKSQLKEDGNLNRTEDLLPTTVDLYKEFFEKFRNIPKIVIPTSLNITKFNADKPLFDHINRELWTDIEKQMKEGDTYNCEIYIDKKIKISISTGKSDDEKIVKEYLENIIFWLHVVNQYATDKCSDSTLNIHLLLSDLKKVLPSGECRESTCVVKNKNVNTGYSVKCRNIVIYRKEEWMKVFIHETIHNYGLDFSFVHQEEEETILNLFGIKKRINVRLYEAYTESWARMIHSMLLAYQDEKDNLIDFINIADMNIRLERINGYFQTCKIIKYMELDQYMNDDMNNLHTYTEDTSNLSYYFIVCILYSDYQNYIKWCRENNKINILQFDNSTNNQQSKFVAFINKKKQSDEFKNKIKYFSTKFFNIVNDDYFHKYMRKSLLEKRV